MKTIQSADLEAGMVVIMSKETMLNPGLQRCLLRVKAIFMNPKLWLVALAALFTVSTATLVPAPAAPQACPQLVSKYDGSNWWWGAFGNCKRRGGPTTPDLIFQCAWNQVPANEQLSCLQTALRGTDQTRRAILEVAANNGGANNCSFLIMEYDGSNWWEGAFGNCKKPGGPATPDSVFQCAWDQVPANEKTDCLKAALRQTDQTHRAIDAVIATNAVAPDTCTQLKIKYDGSNWWWGALGNCKKFNGQTDRNAVFDCAWSQVPPGDQEQCLKTALKGSDQTRRGIDIVVANNLPISNNRLEVNPTEPEVGCHVAGPGTGYFVVPPTLAAPATAPYVLGEGRIRSDLRNAAKAADVYDSLRLAAFNFATGNLELGNAFADLSVTGRKSFAQFKALNMTDEQLFQSIRPPSRGRQPGCGFGCNQAQHCSMGCPPRTPLPDLTGVSNATLLAACKTALDRAFAVAQILRVSNTEPLIAGGSDASTARKALGWMAVSGEDDQPYRPVNVPSTKYPQYDLTVPVRGIDVHTRYMIAQAQAPFATTTPAKGRVLPNDPDPVLAPNADVLIFVHGMDSRAEEAEDLADALRTLAMAKGKNYTVISMDLPSSGYADNLDHCGIPRPRTGLGFCDSLFALGDPKEFPQYFDAHGQHNAPVLDFIEDFVVSFVDTLETKVPVKAKVRAVVGGSLGGNIGFRLGRRQDVPWIRNIVAWSPASVWDSRADGVVVGPSHVSLDHLSVKTTWMNAGGNPDELNETEAKRAQFFNVSFDRPYLDPLPIPKTTQAETWTSDRWPCKRSSITAARLDRLETYDQNFRLWHWRLASEQLIYSHTADGPNGQRLYKSNATHMMLMCGEDDDFTGANICSSTQKIAADMNLTPGRAIFMQNTGHALDNEHPNFVAKQIVAFLGI